MLHLFPIEKEALVLVLPKCLRQIHKNVQMIRARARATITEHDSTR